MRVLAEGRVWTFWMGVGVFLLVMAVSFAFFIGYLYKVVRLKYPPRSAERS